MRGITKITGVIALVAAVGALGACGGSDDSSSGGSGSTAAAAGASGGGSGGGELTLVAYSTPKEAYEAIIPAFQTTDAGKGVTFTESYGASGDQSRAVEAGLGADVVAFALEPDMTRLVDAGLVDASWNADATKGMVTDSVVVFVVRKGNPKGIKTWDDLVKDGVEVINANPFVSGGARWNVMAAYGSQIKQGKTPEEANAYVEELIKNVVVQPKSAREALEAFTGGKGDVLLSYENEAITAQQKGEDIDYIVPDQTILIENPVAVMKDSKKADAAKAFVDFIRTPEAQKIYAEKGYRPVDATVAKDFADQYPVPPALFTIADLGGWAEVMKTYFDKDSGTLKGIYDQLGVATSDG